MTEIEKIGEENFSDFDPKAISKTPHVAGVIELADISREVIFIDASPDINKKLFDLLSSYNPCLDKVKFYRIEINPGVDEGLIKAFTKYKAANNGQIPKCNKVDITRRIK